MFAIFDRLEHQFLGYGIAADQLHHDIDFWSCHCRKGVSYYFSCIADYAARMVCGTVGHQGDFDPASGARLDFCLVALQHLEDAATDGANAQKGDFDGFHGHTDSSKNKLSDVGNLADKRHRAQCGFCLV